LVVGLWSLALGGWFGTDANVQRRVPAISKPRVVKMQLMARPTTDEQRPRANDDHRRRDHSRRSERGYILLMLMLFIALLAIAAGAVAPTIAFRVKRDREEEMIHRGVQYSRALRRFVKKTGRYPSRIEELENTNNIRFLRKRYKDPVTGKDFKLLHVGEVQLASSPGVALGVAASTMGGAAAAGGAGAVALLGAAASGMMAQATAQQASPVMPPTPAAGGDADATGDSGKNAGPGGEQSKTDANQPSGGTSSSPLTSTVFGGGPIVGVASTSKAKTIREFNHKNHYNDWQFIYDPTMDRGGLITTPAQPALQLSAPPVQQNSSSPGNSSGSPSSFGGMQSSPSPAQPAQTPQQ
jgi:type II secretory pathway pseudopilin PulG